jgi:hypothetical protein
MTQQLLPETPEKTQQYVKDRETSPSSAQSLQGGIHPVAQLQRTLGNQWVAKLIQARRLTPEGKIIGLQRKLTVGAADDQYEQEADRVARQVMNTPDAVAASSMKRAMSPEEEKDKMLQTKPLAASITPFMQRQTDADEEEKVPIQTKSTGSMSNSFEAGDDVETQVSQSKGRGSPLPDNVRAYMEPRFGVDFSHVRVHTGSDALQLNRNVGAQAFTHGSDIYFGEGRSPNNFELTAHELTHVVQQTGDVPLQTKRPGRVSSDNTDSSIQRTCAACAKGGTLCPSCAAENDSIQRKFDPASISKAFETKTRSQVSQMREPRTTAAKSILEPLATSLTETVTTTGKTEKKAVEHPVADLAGQALKLVEDFVKNPESSPSRHLSGEEVRGQATSVFSQTDAESGRFDTSRKAAEPDIKKTISKQLVPSEESQGESPKEANPGVSTAQIGALSISAVRKVPNPGHLRQSGSEEKPAISRLAANGTRSHSIQRDEEPSLWDQAASAIGGAAAAVADTVIPEGLLENARSAIDAAQEKAGAVAVLGDEAATNATSESQTIENQVQSSTTSGISSNQQQGDAAAVESRIQVDSIQGSVQSQLGSAEATASSVSSVGTMMGPFLNPAAAVIDFSGIMKSGAGGLELPAPIPAEITNLGNDIGQGIQQGLAEGGTPGWDCDAAEIVAIAGNVESTLTKSAVSVGKRVLGEDRFNALVQFGEETSAKLKAAANQAKSLFKNAEESALAWWQESVTPYLNQIEEVSQAIGQKYEQLKQLVSEGVNAALAWGSEQWERIKTTVVDVVSEGINSARQFIEEKINWVRNLVSRFWDLLPDWLKTAIAGAAAGVAGPAALALAAAQKAAAYIAAHKDEIMAGIRAAADSVVQGFSEKYAAVREVLSEAGSTVKGWMNEAGQSIREAATSAYAEIDEATGGRLSAVRDAVADFGAKVKGEACALLGETAGPCVEQFVPEPGEGGVGFGELTASGDLSVNIEGVPVKVGAGAKIKITRSGQEYTVVISGEGSLEVSLKAEQGGGGGSSGNVSLNLDLPAGGKWKAWEKLTGKTSPTQGPNTASPSATNAPVAQTPPGRAPANPPTSQPPATQQGNGPTPGGPSGPSAEVGAGIKGSVEMTYKFDASKDKTTCDGLGGMTALLASQGLAATLPMPFGNLAGQLGQAAFADRLTSCKFSAAQYADVSIDLLKGDVGSLKFKLGGERGVELESERDLKTGEVTEKATLKNELSGSLAGQLATGPISGLGGSLGLKGSLSISLAYLPAKDEIKTLDLGAKLEASVELTNWSQLRSALPADIAAAVDTGLQPTLIAGSSGVITAEASITIKNLQILASDLDAYCSNPDQVSAGGLWSKVTGFIEDPQNREQGFKIELTETAGLGGVALGGEASSQGTGGSASVAIRRGVTRKKTLYSSGT